jgi:hypothetical protein
MTPRNQNPGREACRSYKERSWACFVSARQKIAFCCHIESDIRLWFYRDGPRPLALPQRAAIILNPDLPGPSAYMPSLEAAARSLKVVPTIAPVHSDAEVETAIIAFGLAKLSSEVQHLTARKQLNQKTDLNTSTVT